MRKILSFALAIVMVLSVAAVAFSAADNTATVSLYGIDGKLSETKTYRVGETFEVTVYLNTSKISTIASFKAEQSYDSSILTLADAYSASSGMISDLDAMFPVTKDQTVANGKLDGRISYNASTPNMDPDGFKFDSDNAVLIRSHYTVKAAGNVSINNSITTLAQADYNMTRIVDQGTVKNNNFTMRYTLSDPAPIEGNAVTGTITSYLSDTDTVTVELLKGEVVAYSTTVTGNTAAYSIGDVADGGYTLRVSKKNHVARDYTITVSGGAVQDAKICPIGDVTMDGKLTTMDVTRANAHVKGTAALEGYALLLGDTAGGAGITTIDVTRINSHVQGKNPLW